MQNVMKSAAFAAALITSGAAQAQDDLNITLVPGLTTDAFYITMNRGAQAAAEDVLYCCCWPSSCPNPFATTTCSFATAEKSLRWC